MSAVREKLDDQSFEHLIRGGTIAFIIPPSQRGNCLKVEVCLADIGYELMQRIIAGAAADRQRRLGLIESIGQSP